MTVQEAPASLLIRMLAEQLRREPHLGAPSFASFVKTGSQRERAPADPNWWQARCASLLRKLYLRGPLGLSKLRSSYGGRVKKGYSPGKHRLSGGSIIREALQQLEAAGYVVKQPRRGRMLSSKGMSKLDKLSNEILKELAKSQPALAKYA